MGLTGQEIRYLGFRFRQPVPLKDRGAQIQERHPNRPPPNDLVLVYHKIRLDRSI